jgi:hypothetical protein
LKAEESMTQTDDLTLLALAALEAIRKEIESNGED